MSTPTILVALDGSGLAETALDFAEHLATTTRAHLVLCRAVPIGVLRHVEVDVDALDRAKAYVQKIADRRTLEGYVVETRTPWGDPASAILETADASRADLIVIATHGRSGLGRWLYGSVADGVMRASNVPLIVVPPDAQLWPNAGPMRIVVPLDTSKLAETALPAAAFLARGLEAELVLVQVVEYPPYALYTDPNLYVAAYDVEAMQTQAENYLAGMADNLRREGLRVRTRVEFGRPTTLIADVAQAEHATVIAMATHGRGGLERAVLGSVATRTLQRATMPLMLVRSLPVERQPAGIGSTHTGARRESRLTTP